MVRAIWYRAVFFFVNWLFYGFDYSCLNDQSWNFCLNSIWHFDLNFCIINFLCLRWMSIERNLLFRYFLLLLRLFDALINWIHQTLHVTFLNVRDFILFKFFRTFCDVLQYIRRLIVLLYWTDLCLCCLNSCFLYIIYHTFYLPIIRLRSLWL